jgi:hypothetical protein
MPEPTPYPYATHLNVQFKSLELVDLQPPVRTVVLMIEGAGVVPTGD